MSIDSKAISATAYALHHVSQTKGRGWQLAGLQSAVNGAVSDDGRTVEQVLRAGLETLSDANAKTPAAIRWEARYVGQQTASTTAEPINPEVCKTCARTRPAHDAAESKLAPADRHEWELRPDRRRPQPREEPRTDEPQAAQRDPQDALPAAPPATTAQGEPAAV